MYSRLLDIFALGVFSISLPEATDLQSTNSDKHSRIGRSIFKFIRVTVITWELSMPSPGVMTAPDGWLTV